MDCGAEAETWVVGYFYDSLLVPSHSIDMQVRILRSILAPLSPHCELSTFILTRNVFIANRYTKLQGVKRSPNGLYRQKEGLRRVVGYFGLLENSEVFMEILSNHYVSLVHEGRRV